MNDEPSWRQRTDKTSELNDVWAAMFRLRDAICDAEAKLTHLDKLDADRAARFSASETHPSPGGARLGLNEAGQAAQSPQDAPQAKTPPNVTGLRPGIEIVPGDGSGAWRLCPQCGRQYDSEAWWAGMVCPECYRRGRRRR